MTATTTETRFVKPHFIEELGEEGLTLHEVAQSLQIQFKHAKEALEKNINDYSLVEISAYVDKGPIRGTVEVSSYALTTDDAKFFVAKYNNEIGKSYLRYLLQCEKAVEAIARQAMIPTTPRTEAEEIIGVWSRVGAILEAPKHLVQIEAVKEAKRVAGVDFSPLLKIAPAQDDIREEEVMLEPTELAERLSLRSGTEVNKRLKASGLQVRVSGRWEPTERGKEMSARHSWKSGSKSGYNLKWNVSKVAKELGIESI